MLPQGLRLSVSRCQGSLASLHAPYAVRYAAVPWDLDCWRSTGAWRPLGASQRQRWVHLLGVGLQGQLAACGGRWPAKQRLWGACRTCTAADRPECGGQDTQAPEGCPRGLPERARLPPAVCQTGPAARLAARGRAAAAGGRRRSAGGGLRWPLPCHGQASAPPGPAQPPQPRACCAPPFLPQLGWTADGRSSSPARKFRCPRLQLHSSRPSFPASSHATPARQQGAARLGGRVEPGCPSAPPCHAVQAAGPQAAADRGPCVPAGTAPGRSAPLLCRRAQPPAGCGDGGQGGHR